jgi:hypothetical protein
VDRHAEVRALEQSDGTLIALWIRIRVEPETTTWEGRIDRLPWLPWGFWVVDGQSVMVTPATEVTGLEPEVGLWAQVDAERRNSLPWHAVKIEVKPALLAGTAKPGPSNN